MDYSYSNQVLMRGIMDVISKILSSQEKVQGAGSKAQGTEHKIMSSFITLRLVPYACRL